MALTITDAAYAALNQSTKEPNIVLKIDGVDRIFGASIVKKYSKFGDADLVFGDPAVLDDATYFGGLNAVDNQDNAITLDGTSTSIRQTLNVDKGEGASISTLSVALIDNGYLTELITPSAIVDDILMRQCLVYMGFNGTAWPDDYVVIFRGLITDITADPGKVIFQLNHADDKKRTNIFKKVEAKTVLALNSSQTSIALDTVANFLEKIEGPDNAYDPAFESCILIDDEIVKYEFAESARTTTGTVTIASPGVWSNLNHNLENGDAVYFTSTGALPTGLSQSTYYYVVNKTTNTFQVSATVGGSAINTSGAQNGTHTIHVPARITGCTRGYLSTTAASHDDDSGVSTYYRLIGNGVHLALKIMASGNVIDGVTMPFVQDIPFTSINVGGTERYDNALFFKDTDVESELGLVAGDWLQECGGSQYLANRVRDKQVIEIIKGELGDFVIIDDVSFVDDVSIAPDNELTCAFTSQFATLPDGCRFRPDEIDVEEHLRLYRLFLSSLPYDIYIKDGIENAKEFIEKTLYLPMAAYSLPRKARASMGYHIGPIPGANIVTFDESNIKNVSKIQLRRSANKNFFNEIVYKFDEDPIEDKFNTGYVTISANSKNRITNAPNRTLTIEAKGLRTTDLGDSIAQDQSERRIKRYEYGAETLVFETFLADGYTVEIGDIIIVDGTNLNLPDIKTGEKGMKPRFFEVQNKDFQLKTGNIRLEVIDTNYEGAARYGLIAPASRIKTGLSTTEFLIEESYGARFGAAEYRKWKPFKRCAVRVRSEDGSTLGVTTIVSATSNQITVSPALAFTPSAGMIMELATYNSATDQIKLLYAHMKDADFDDGLQQFQML